MYAINYLLSHVKHCLFRFQIKKRNDEKDNVLHEIVNN